MTKRPCTPLPHTDGIPIDLTVNNGSVFPFKNALSHGPPSNTWFIGPTRVHSPNGISIGSVVFAWFSTVTDRPTDTPHHRSRIRYLSKKIANFNEFSEIKKNRKNSYKKSLGLNTRV